MLADGANLTVPQWDAIFNRVLLAAAEAPKPADDRIAGFGEWLHRLRTDYLKNGRYRENDDIGTIGRKDWKLNEQEFIRGVQ